MKFVCFFAFVCQTFVINVDYNKNKDRSFMKTILFVDDQQDILHLLKQYALKEGYDVLCAQDGEEALHQFYSNNPDIVCLDVMMPKKDGFEVVKEIRKTSMVPIIMITAKAEDYEKIMGLDIGADDYITKPFSFKELMARIAALLRRADGFTQQEIKVGELSIHPSSYQVSYNQHDIHVTKKEFELIHLFAKNINRVYTREDLLALLWGFDYEGDDRTVDAHIKRLREKLENANVKDCQITTIWGVGYKFEVNHENT